LRGLPSTGGIDVKFCRKIAVGKKSVDALCVDDLYVNQVGGYDAASFFTVFSGSCGRSEGFKGRPRSLQAPFKYCLSCNQKPMQRLPF